MTLSCVLTQLHWHLVLKEQYLTLPIRNLLSLYILAVTLVTLGWLRDPYANWKTGKSCIYRDSVWMWEDFKEIKWFPMLFTQSLSIFGRAHGYWYELLFQSSLRSLGQWMAPIDRASRVRTSDIPMSHMLSNFLKLNVFWLCFVLKHWECFTVVK